MTIRFVSAINSVKYIIAITYLKINIKGKIHLTFTGIKLIIIKLIFAFNNIFGDVSKWGRFRAPPVADAARNKE